MIDPMRPARRVLPLLVASVVIVAACGGGVASPPPSASAAAVNPSAPPTAEPDPTPTAEPIPTPELIPTACLSLGDIDCQRAAGLARQVLLETDPPVVYVQAGPFACREGAQCATTLDARPEGDVTLEFADGTALLVHLKDEAGAVQQTRSDAMGILVEPSSQVGSPAGPQPYTLGHCGIFSGIDADGSWWDPVGPVDMDSGDAVNATEGVLNLTDPTHGTFTAPSGFAVQLQRRNGAKVLPPCM
jgi:hypothetical protein